MKIPSRAKFDALSKNLKIDLLRELRREHDDSVIRDAWKYSTGAYYNLLYRYGLSEGRRYNKRVTEEPAAAAEQQEETKQRTIITDDDILEAEFRVVEEPKPEPPKQPSLVPALIQSEVSVDLPFPAIKGTPAQLRKTFEAVVMFLEAQESEEARFEIRLSVVKA